jgi:transposase-like protein
MMFKGRRFDRSVILLCVRWYLAHNVRLRNLKEMIAERGISVDHATIHRWTVHYASHLLERSNRRKRTVTGNRPMLGFKSTTTARVILAGIEMVHMMRKQQVHYAFNPQPSSRP